MSAARERRLATVQAVLADAATSQDLAIAYWPEADGDAGYLVAPDGRMLPIGDYQFGVTHVQALADGSAEERRELGRVSGEIMLVRDYVAEYGELPNNLELIGPALAAWAQGALDGAVVQALLENVPETADSAGPAQAPNGTVCVHADVGVDVVGTNVAGGWGWQRVRAAQAGETVPAHINRLGQAYIASPQGAGRGSWRLPNGSFDVVEAPSPGPAAPPASHRMACGR